MDNKKLTIERLIDAFELQRLKMLAYQQEIDRLNQTLSMYKQLRDSAHETFKALDKEITKRKIECKAEQEQR